MAFYSSATNLVPGDTGGFTDIFVHDLAAGTTMRITVNIDAVQADGDSLLASVSGDGTAVAFESIARNNVPKWPFIVEFRKIRCS